MRELPADYARCNGVNIDGQWREGCEDCLRRTSKKTPDGKPLERAWMMAPPPIIVFECEYRIAPEEHATQPRELG